MRRVALAAILIGLVTMGSLAVFASDSLLQVRESGIVDLPRQSTVVARSHTISGIPFDTNTKLILTVENVDTQDEFDPTTGLFTASEDGTYLVSFNVSWIQSSLTANKDYHAIICLDGAPSSIAEVLYPAFSTGHRAPPTVSGSGLFVLSSGQTIGICVIHGSSASASVNQAHLQVAKVN